MDTSKVKHQYLTRALHGLEEHGLVSRTEYNKIPPHVEYSLTESCKELLPALEIINQWGKSQVLTDHCEENAVKY